MFLTRKGILDWSKTSLVCKKKHGLENRTMWPVAIIGLFFGMQKYIWAAKDILICKKIQFAKNILRKQDGCGPWLLTLCLGCNLSRLVAQAGVAKLDLNSIWDLKKSKKRQKIQRLSVRIATALIMNLARTSIHLLRREKQRQRRNQQGETQLRDKNAIEMQNIQRISAASVCRLPLGLWASPARLPGTEQAASWRTAGRQPPTLHTFSIIITTSRSRHSASMA